MALKGEMEPRAAVFFWKARPMVFFKAWPKWVNWGNRVRTDSSRPAPRIRIMAGAPQTMPLSHSLAVSIRVTKVSMGYLLERTGGGFSRTPHKKMGYYMDCGSKKQVDSEKAFPICEL